MAFVLLASCGQTTGVCEAVSPASKLKAAGAEVDCSSTFLEDSSARLTDGTSKTKGNALEIKRFQGKRRALSAQSCELEAAAVAVSWSSSVDPTTVSVEVGQHSLTTLQGDLDGLCCSLPSMRFSKTDGAVFPSWVCAVSLQHEAERIIPCHAAKL